jgi:hypothetical protein
MNMKLKSVLFLPLVFLLVGCAGVERQETRCMATRTLDADGRVKIIETCTGTSVQKGYPTFPGSGVNQKW